MSEGCSFGQEVPPLVDLLRDILDRYPEGGQILKELIQNADDAGATEVKFLLDARKNVYGIQKLVKDSLQEFQGQALYAQNNAVFKQEDWSSIQKPYRSIKKEDPMKVGKFGIGFNSIYHLTDFPSVISGHNIGFFDPHQQHFGKGETGRMFTMNDAKNERYRDQFSPYMVLDCDMEQATFTGTLFRFPLRCKPSKLSSNICTEKRIQELFLSFQADAHLVLLFLKAVEAITIYEWLPGKHKPSEIFKVHLSEATRAEVRDKRRRLLRDISSAGSPGYRSIRAGNELEQFYHAEVVCISQEKNSVTQRWLVQNYINTREDKIHSTAVQLAQIPWVGLAVPIGQMTKHAQGLGRIFCFLPLPPSEDADSNTGLPVHVHGSFSVADNRRSLKWPAGDRLKDEKAIWNQQLTEQLLGRAYVNLILHAIRQHHNKEPVSPEDVYRMWPDPQRVHYRWREYLLPHLFYSLSQNPVLWTETSGGKWVPIREAIVSEKSKSELPLSESVAVQEMLRMNRPVVFPPAAVLKCLGDIASQHGVKATPMSPAIVRTSLEANTRYEQMSRLNKVQLLKYVMEDHCYSALQHLSLLPLADGSFTKFDKCMSPVYISSPTCRQSLFPGLEGEFLDEKIDHKVLQSLKSATETRLCTLKVSDVPTLVSRVLPAEWNSLKENFVETPPEIGGVQTDSWISDLWLWINKHHDEVQVSCFEECYILPVTSSNGNKTLRKLKAGQALIVEQIPHIDIQIKPDLIKYLEAIGCGVLVKTPQYLLSCYPLYGREQYVCRPTEIVSCMARLSIAPLAFKILTLRQRQELVSILSSTLRVSHQLSSHERSVLCHLPVFRQHGSDDPISVAECSKVAPVQLPRNLPLKACLLASPSREEETILFSSGVLYRNMTVENIYCEIVIPQFDEYSDQQREMLVKFILENIHLVENSNILKQLSRLEFVKTKDSMLAAPQELFDPTKPYVEKLFADQAVFPTGTFDVGTKHGKLLCEHVGLRKLKDLTSEELLQIAKNVAVSSEASRARSLLDLIVNEAWAQELLQRADIGEALSHVAWVPVLCNPCKDYPSKLNWAGCDSLFVSSRIVPFTEDVSAERLQLVVGSQLCILDHQKPLPNFVTRLLRFAVADTVYRSVIRHLRSVYELWIKGLVSSTDTVKVEKLLFEVFRFLGNCDDEGLYGLLKQELNEKWPWVWLDKVHRFVHPFQLIHSSSCPPMEPWLFKVEQYEHLEGCTKLLREYGMKDDVAEADCLFVLEQMQSWTRCQEAEVDNARNYHNLNLAIEILKWVIRDLPIIPDDLRSKVLVPVDREDNRLELAPACELMYLDAGRFSRGQDLELDQCKLVHKNITAEIAHKLRVPSLSSRLAPSEDLEFEQLGPNESLTLRIKNILKEYKDDAGIFKELLQNADDAGASKVCFLVDWRKHGTSSSNLLAPGMKSCQGPALWAYNDSAFRDEDFSNIAKLAAATKQTKLDKIGRFGLGFTSVYHVTEVPSFVSRRFIVVFDPHRTHLGSHIRDPAKPGVKIDFIRDPVARRFPDQFLPYKDVFGCNLECQNEFNGTLFRFPFRTDKQAENSEIKRRPFDKKRVKYSLEALKKACPKLLLFLNNVRSVELFELSQEATNFAERKLLLSIQSEVTPLLNSSRRGAILSECCEEVRRKALSLPSNRRDSIELLKLSVTEIGKGPECCQETWVSCAHAGDSHAFAYACGTDGTELGLVPFAGVAAKLEGCCGGRPISLQQSLMSPISIPGESFCFLPLSEKTGLPFHVNGFFSVNSNRRGIWWFGTEETSVSGCEDRDAVWNQRLIGDSLIQSFVGLLKCFASVFRGSSTNIGPNYYKLWPLLEQGASPSWQYVVKQFYGTASKCKEDIVCTATIPIEWIPVHDCLILSEAVTTILYPAACQVMVRFCTSYVEFPDHVVKGLRFADNFLVNKISVSLEKFVEDWFAPNISSIEVSVRDEITTILLTNSLSNSSLATSMKKLRLIPCSCQESYFKQAAELIDPNCPEAQLYVVEEGRFPADGVYRESKIISAMKELGMRSSGDFRWDDVVERAKTVEELEKISHDRALERILALVRLIDTLSKDSRYAPSPADIASIATLKFLPIAERPKDYPLRTWYSEITSGKKVAGPVDLYHFNCRNTIGSSALVLDCSLPTILPFEHVFQLLGVKYEPPLSLVLKHLDVVVETLLQASRSPPRSLTSLVHEVYQLLNSKIADSNSRGVLITELENKRWIRVRSHVVKPEQLAFHCDQEVPPYLFRVPEELREDLQSLLEALKIKKKFGADDFVGVLKQIAREGSSSSKKEIEKNFRKALSLLHELENCDLQDLKKYKGSIPVLTETKTLLPASDVAFNDAPWVILPSDNRHIFVHKHISRELAQKLGVKLVRGKLLDEHAEDWLGEPFGQSEPLCQRLNNILEGYPFGEAILKELLQNADDARATQLHFIYDKRNHGKECVLSDNWSELQGEALCVYNNRTFSDKDIKGIQSLGLGSKRDDPSLTGQYGIGFNAVYHLTDCPSFITNNERLCIMDPHCRYVVGATVGKPGRMYRTDERFWERFPDLRSCYCGLPGITMKGGTLFRFPLRSPEMASRSKIWSKTVDMTALFKEFEQGAADMLLFLNHVSSIKLSVIEADGSTKNSVTVSSSVSDEVEEKRGLLADRIAKNKRTPTASIEYFDVTYELTVTCTRLEENYFFLPQIEQLEYSQTWLVHQSLGLPAKCDLPDVSELRLLPRAGIAAPMQCEWQQSTGSRKAYCFLPLPIETGLPVHVNGHFALNDSRRNLWQDDSKHRPSDKQQWNDGLIKSVIAPAYCRFLLEARNHVQRALQLARGVERELETRLRWFHELFPNLEQSRNRYWNSLAKEVYGCIAQGRHHILACVNQPLYNETQNIVAKVRLCRCEKDRHTIDDCVGWFSTSPTLRWLPVATRHLAPGLSTLYRAYFWDEQNVDSVPNHVTQYIFKCLLLVIGFPVVASPIIIKAALNKVANNAAATVCPMAVGLFLRNYSNAELGCNVKLGDVGMSVLKSAEYVSVILQYLLASKGGTADGLTQLNGIPLLVTQSGQLKLYSEQNPVYLSRYSRLLPNHYDRFLCKELLSVVGRYLNIDKAKVFRKLSPEHFGDLLPSSGIFPAGTAPCDSYWQWNELERPNRQWIETLWSYLRSADAVTGQLNCLSQWPIIPVLGHGKGCLVPTSLGFTLFEYTSSTGNSRVKNILKDLSVPELDVELTSKVDEYTVDDSKLHPHLKSLVAGLNDVEKVAQALCYHFQHSRLTRTLSVKEADLLLRYFESAIVNRASSIIQWVKCLPLFEALDGSLVDVYSCNECHALPDIPTNGFDAWKGKASRITFLKSKQNLEELYEVLGLDNMTFTLVYVRFILDAFPDMKAEDRMEHLLFIRKYHTVWKADSTDDPVIEKLRRTPCVPIGNAKSGEEVLLPVCGFFDWTDDVFKLMLEPEQPGCFPPEQFRDEEWREFLLKLDLQTKASKKQIIEFAQRLETVVARCCCEEEREDYTRKAKAVVAHMLKHYCNDDFVLRTASKICFIPVEKCRDTLTKLAKPRADRRTMGWVMAYNESVRYTVENESLCWTVDGLLPTWAKPSDSEAGQVLIYSAEAALGIKANPTIHNVVLNLLIIIDDCRQLYRTGSMDEKKKDGLRRVLSTIFRHLQKQCPCCRFNIGMPLKKQAVFRDLRNPSNTCEHASCRLVYEKLHSCACIFVEDCNTFVKPYQVVINVSDETSSLAPYLSKLPDYLIGCKSILKLLGVEEQPETFHYARVLEQLHNNSIKDGGGQTTLLPEELEVVRNVTKLLFDQLKKVCLGTGKRKPGGDGYSEEDLLICLKPFFLPSRAREMEVAVDLVHLDRPEYEDCVSSFGRPFLQRLQVFKLPPLSSETIDLLPVAVRPSCLSELAKEILTEGLDEDDEEEELQAFAEQLQTLISSDNFASGLYSTIIHEQQTSCLPRGVAEGLASLKFIKVKCLTRLVTCLHFKEYRDKIVPGSERKDVSCFLEEPEDDESSTLYVTFPGQRRNNAYTQLLSNIATILGRLIPMHFRGEVAVSLLACDNPSGVLKCLSRQGIPFMEYEQEKCLTESPNSLLAFHPGDEVDKRLIDDELIRTDINYDFYVGEKVAYEVDGKLIYGIVVEEEKGNSSLSPVERVYYINIGGEEKVRVNAVDLYKFDRQLHQHWAPDQSLSLVTASTTPREEQTIDPNCSLEDKLEFIRRRLDEIWQISDREVRRKAIKRLYLVWHPDRSEDPDCSEAFKFLKQEIDRRESQDPAAHDRHGSYSGNSSKSRKSCSKYYQAWNSAAATTASQRRRRRRRFQSSYGYHEPPKPRPNPELGRKFVLQAWADYRAASYLMTAEDSQFFATACFLCQHAVEKALIGAWYVKQGLLDSGSDSRNIHRLVSLHQLPGCPDQLVVAARKATHFSPAKIYPDNSNDAPAASGEYNREQAEARLSAASDLLETVQEFIRL
jgi:sacsin